MKKLCLLTCLAALAIALGAQEAPAKLLFVYDEVNANSSPYIERFEKAFEARGIAYEAASVAELPKKELSEYRGIVIHGMVMAFNAKSPVRDWLKGGPKLEGKKVSLFVTANRWFLDKLHGQLATLLKKDGAELVDSVSMATKTIDETAKNTAVQDFVAKLP
jgi:hypothetical protein